MRMKIDESQGVRFASSLAWLVVLFFILFVTVPTPLQAVEAGRQVLLQAEAAGYRPASATLALPGTGPFRIMLEGTVRDEQGKVAPGVRLRSPDWELETRTDTVGHYQLMVEEPGGRPFQGTLDFTLAREEEVQVATNPATGRTYQGLVADGVSRLIIFLHFPNHPNEQVSVALPTFGRLDSNTLSSTGLVRLDATGSATLAYLPPTDIPRMKLIQRLPLAGRQVWSVVIPLRVHLTEGMKERTVEVYLALYRPPVLLVSDLLNDPAAWEPYAGMLRSLRFDALSISLQQESLADQAGELGLAVKRVQDEYAASEILLSRLDIVSLGTGGLAARGFLATKPVLCRKLILVGTPNGGIGPLAEPVLAWYEAWEKGHPVAASQLVPGSPTLQNLPRVSLSPDVEVGVLFGDGPQGDGLVLPGSAVLPGATAVGLVGLVHTASLPITGMSLVDAQPLRQRIESWLLAPIPSLPAKMILLNPIPPWVVYSSLGAMALLAIWLERRKPSFLLFLALASLVLLAGLYTYFLLR